MYLHEKPEKTDKMVKVGNCPSSPMCVYGTPLVNHFRGLDLTCPLFLLCPVLWCAIQLPQVQMTMTHLRSTLWPHFLPSGL